MPRSNPLPESERAICRRLRDYRKSLHLNRIAFAIECMVDSEVLSRVENFRAPMRIGVFRKVAARFPLNPRWLATGEGPRSFPVDVPRLADLGVAPEDLFSKVYQSKISPILGIEAGAESAVDVIETSTEEVFAATPRGRYAAATRLREDLNFWISRVPDNELTRFVQEARAAMSDLLDRYSAASSEEVTSRFRLLEQLQDEAVFRGELFQSGSERLSYGLALRGVQRFGRASDLRLTEQAEKLIYEPVPAKLLQGLLQRLRKATAARGMKLELAKWMKVHPQCITDWLTERKEPSGETTLRLLRWVTQREQQHQPPGSENAKPGK